MTFKKTGFAAFLFIFSLFMMTLTVNAADSNAAASAEEEGEAKSAYGFEFVKLDPLILPVIDKDGLHQTLSLVIAIEVKRVSHADKVRMLEPRLKDAFIQEMYGIINRHAAMKNGVLQVKMVKDQLKKISQRIVGDDIVTDVLLQVVQQRQL